MSNQKKLTTMEGKWEYFVYGNTITGHINELREMVEELRVLANVAGSDLTKTMHSFAFAVEVDYQSYHNLDQDNWEMVHL